MNFLQFESSSLPKVYYVYTSFRQFSGNTRKFIQQRDQVIVQELNQYRPMHLQ